jgi:hypothetical protein
MANGAAGALGFALVVGMIAPSAAQDTLQDTLQDKLEIPLTTLGGNRGANTTLSFGAVGLDSHAANSYVPARGDDPYYFLIPSQRPARKGTGLLFRIPFGNASSH